MKRTTPVLLAVLALAAGGAGAAGAAAPASASIALPWNFVQVHDIESLTVPSGQSGLDYTFTATCPAGWTPITGGVSGPPVAFNVIAQYANYPDNSYSEEIFTETAGTVTFQLLVNCAEADQVGSIEIASADFGEDSSGQAGGYVTCPAGTKAIGGGAYWHQGGARNLQFSAPTSDELGWYADASSTTPGDTLHVEAYCIFAGSLTGTQYVSTTINNPTPGNEYYVSCPYGTRVLDGGVFGTPVGGGVSSYVFAGYMEESFPSPTNVAAWGASTPGQIPANTALWVTAWCAPVSQPQVTITSTPPAVTNQTSAQFTFIGSDPVGYQLTYTCWLDFGPVNCDGPTGASLNLLYDGSHLFTVYADNPDGGWAFAQYQWTVDTVAPTVVATAPADPVTLVSSATVSWAGQDNTGGSGIASYQVRERTAAYSTGFTPWTYPTRWQALSPATTSVTATDLARGSDYCFAIRATDKAGNTSPWTTPACTALPLDDRSLTVSAGWTRGTGSRYWNGTITTTTRHGATAQLTGARLDRVAIVATRGPGMGTIAIYIGAVKIGTISLAVRTTHYRSLILLPPFSYRTGTVRIKVTSTGKPVQLDGLAITRS